ncbi:MAG TPA: DUF4433 domain-containing protein, partial [Sulfuricurvum sp.]|nr:DUF4433 domain-containing protein [Sulfuricurvum sp.]
MKLIDNLDRYGIKSIWHFTDRSNLASIERHGLLSLSEIARRSVNVSAFGANEESHAYDRRFGLDRFVHLSFLMDHPMYYVAVRRKS